MSELAIYNAKRNRNKTPEPMPHEASKTKHAMLFVVQKHRARRLHYDLRLQLLGVLKSWAVPKGISTKPNEKRLAVMVEDHPLAYKDFQGEIPHGEYGAGTVEIWDQGEYKASNASSPEASEEQLAQAIAKGVVHVHFFGRKLKGEYILVRTASKKAKNAWLIFKKGKEKITQDALPSNIKPMLAKVAPKAFNRKGWQFELKWDGWRAMATLHDKKVQLTSRQQRSLTRAFAHIQAALVPLAHKHDAVLDGELVVVDNQGHCDFAALKHPEDHQGKLVYYVFDILYLDGHDLRKRPLFERRELLENLLSHLKSPTIRLSDDIEEKGRWLYQEACRLQLEGIIAKRSDSTYQMRRSDDWLKIKTPYARDQKRSSHHEKP